MPTVQPDSSMVCVLQVGSILFTVVILTIHLEVASILEYWTWVHHVCIWFSAGGQFARTPEIML